LAGTVTWTTPRGGFFLWAAFPPAIDTDELNRGCAPKGVLYVPGSAFYVEHRRSQHVRLSFSAHAPDRIDLAVRRLAGATRDALSATASPGRDSAAAR
jgi:2-aminoadipate transaminase